MRRSPASATAGWSRNARWCPDGPSPSPPPAAAVRARGERDHLQPRHHRVHRVDSGRLAEGQPRGGETGRVGLNRARRHAASARADDPVHRRGPHRIALPVYHSHHQRRREVVARLGGLLVARDQEEVRRRAGPARQRQVTSAAAQGGKQSTGREKVAGIPRVANHGLPHDWVE